MMTTTAASFESVRIGDMLPSLSLPPLTKATLALYADVSGDPNPIHVDAEFARAAGMPDVLAHGMLLMALLGLFLSQSAPLRELREFGLFFCELTFVGERITCTGRVVDKQERDGERLAKIEVKTTNDAGELKVVGDAWIALH